VVDAGLMQLMLLLLMMMTEAVMKCAESVYWAIHQRRDMQMCLPSGVVLAVVQAFVSDRCGACTSLHCHWCVCVCVCVWLLAQQ